MVTIDIKDIKGLSGTYSVKFGKSKKYTKIDEDKLILFGRMKSYAHGGWLHYKIQEILISKQKTGFGYKSFFVCPVCGERRTRIYCHENKELFKCRSCIGKNIYSERCNLYDEGGVAVIEYKINKLLHKLNIENFNPKTVPPMPIDFAGCKPKYMRYEEFDLLVRQIMMLYKLKQNVDYQLAKYTTSEINYFIHPCLIGKMDNLFINIISSSVFYDKEKGCFTTYSL